MVDSAIIEHPLPVSPMQTTNNKAMTNEESYADRRQLFKNIWEAAMSIDGKEDVMTKPKVIKTLRLDEVDKCVVGKTKKQRIKNLRHVCKRILDFCDKQDANDILYENLPVDAQDVSTTQDKATIEIKAAEKNKTHIVIKKKAMKKANSMFGPVNGPTQVVMAAVSEQKDALRKVKKKTSSITVPTKIKRTSLLKDSDNFKKSPMNIGAAAGTSYTATKESPIPATQHRSIKKRHCKRKKHLKTNVIAPGNPIIPSNLERPRHTRHDAVDPTETLRKPKMNKIMTN